MKYVILAQFNGINKEPTALTHRRTNSSVLGLTNGIVKLCNMR